LISTLAKLLASNLTTDGTSSPTFEGLKRIYPAYF